MAGAIGNHKVVQVGIIVRDVEEAKKKWAAFLGMDVPPTCDAGVYEVTKTVYKGAPAEEATCYMAFFNVFENFQIELIQPNEAHSTWRDFLDSHGEGIHHIAFNTDNTDAAIARCEEQGLILEQRGFYGDASGEYSYLAAPGMSNVVIELLESFRK